MPFSYVAEMIVNPSGLYKKIKILLAEKKINTGT